ncbi:MAG TPA: hypothetical protein VFA70_02690, partial [Dehalococcoidia bacterium]|nr:hypothetical protein [Dehalococcoidia bacterium]
VLAVALFALASVSAASAQQAPGVVGTIYNEYGYAVGQAQVVVSGGQMQISITAKGMTANATYSVCATGPLTAQTVGCQGAYPSIAGLSPCLFGPVLATVCVNNSVTPTATLTTDQSGAGTAQFTVPFALPVVVIQLTNIYAPGDNAQAVIQTGASGTLCSPGGILIIGGC